MSKISQDAVRSRVLDFLRAAYQHRDEDGTLLASHPDELLVLSDWLEECQHPRAADVRELTQVRFASVRGGKALTRGGWWTVTVRNEYGDEWAVRWLIWRKKIPEVEFRGVARRAGTEWGTLTHAVETVRLRLIAALFGIKLHWVVGARER